jgi:hypothetical protein
MQMFLYFPAAAIDAGEGLSFPSGIKNKTTGFPLPGIKLSSHL